MKQHNLKQFGIKSLILAMAIGASAPVALAAGNPSATTQDKPLISEETKRTFQEGWLEGKLDTAILLNTHLNPFDIETTVRGKTAYLSGEVESDVEKELAENIALGITGIEKVENNLTIQPGSAKATMDEDKHSFTQAISDATTTATVKAKLLASDGVKGMDVDVSTDNGVVTLKGQVPSDAVKDLAEQIASNVEGVLDVNNRLTISDKVASH